MKKSTFAIVGIALSAVLAAGGLAVPAAATTLHPTTEAELIAALASAGEEAHQGSDVPLDPTVELGGNITVTAETITIPWGIKFDLNNYSLTARNITAGEGPTVEIFDTDRDSNARTSGRVTADATGTSLAAITVGPGRGIDLHGGLYLLNGGTGAAAIGGNAGSAAGFIYVHEDAIVQPHAVGAPSVFGGGAGNTAIDGILIKGKVVLAEDETLRAGSKNYISIPSPGVVAGDGTVDGGTDPDSRILASGGTITTKVITGLVDGAVDVEFTYGEFLAQPEKQYVRVFAPTFRAGIATGPPIVPIAPLRVFQYWKSLETGKAFSTEDVTADNPFYVSVATQVTTATMATLPSTVTAGQSIDLDVTGFDNNLAPANQSPFVHVTTGNSSDIIDANHITFMSAGPRTITVDLYLKAGSTTVHVPTQSLSVVTGDVSKLEVSLPALPILSDPTVHSAQAGVPTTVVVTALDAGENVVATPPVELKSNVTSDRFSGDAVTFSKAGSTLHEITASYSATGGATVTGKALSVMVVPGELATILVNTNESVKSGVPHTISVIGRDVESNVTAVEGPVTFTFAGTSGPGDIVSSGTVTFGAAGSRSIVAHANGLESSFLVEVSAGDLAHLVINTDSTVTAGESASYVVSGSDAAGNAVMLDDPATVTTGIEGDTIDATTATYSRAGSHTLTAKSGKATGTAEVTVKPAALDSISIAVSTTSPITGTKVSIVASGRDRFANPVRVTDAKFTSTSARDVFGTGTITLGLPGKRTITASSGLITGTTSVTVNKDTPKVSVKLPSSFKKDKKTVLTVKVAAGASKLATTGTVRVYYTASKYVSAKLTAASKGSVRVTVPKLKKGTYVVTAKYLGSTTYLAKATAPVKRKAK